MLRVFASVAVLGTIALAPSALASANGRRVSDPRDVQGPLDIAAVTGTHVGRNLVQTLRTYKPFPSKLLSGHTFIAFGFDTNRDATLDDFAIAVWFRGALRGALLDTSGEQVASLRAARPDSRTVQLTIPARLLGSPAVYSWIADAEYQGKPGCRTPCIDMAPNHGMITQQLRPLAGPMTVHIVGPGRVLSIPPGIACPGRCVAKFGRGDTVWLNAAPTSNAVFTGWSGACTGTAACRVTVTAAQSVTATFVPAYTLTVVTTAPGSVLVTPPGTTCTSAQTCINRFASGTTVTLTAQAPAGYRFEGWAGDCSGTAPTCTVTMTGDKVVSAVFSVAPAAGPATPGAASARSGGLGLYAGYPPGSV